MKLSVYMMACTVVNRWLNVWSFLYIKNKNSIVLFPAERHTMACTVVNRWLNVWSFLYIKKKKKKKII